MAASDLSGIIVTHEHQDHIGGVFKLARRHKIPVWMSVGTFQATEADSHDVNIHFCRDSEKLSIGDLELMPYTVPHDAREPLQYCASDGQFKLGVLTDAGHSTAHMIEVLGGCDALVLECNHDSQLLAESSYPSFLKRRISSPFGHLSNLESCDLLRNLDQSRLKRLVGAHLSASNNKPELALKAMREGAKSAGKTEIEVACQDEGFSWIQMSG